MKFYTLILFPIFLNGCHAIKINDKKQPDKNYVYSIKDSEINHELKNEFLGTWFLKNSSLFDSTLVFQKENKIDKNQYEIFKFKFSENNLTLERSNRRTSCPVGNLIIKDARWNIVSDKFYLLIMGAYSQQEKFKKASKYNIISKTKNEFQLQLEKVLINEILKE